MKKSTKTKQNVKNALPLKIIIGCVFVFFATVISIFVSRSEFKFNLSSAQSGTGVLIGSVTNIQDLSTGPIIDFIRSAQVSAEGTKVTTFTDSRGGFVLRDLPESFFTGTQYLTVSGGRKNSGDNITAYSFKVEVKSGQVITLDTLDNSYAVLRDGVSHFVKSSMLNTILQNAASFDTKQLSKNTISVLTSSLQLPKPCSTTSVTLPTRLCNIEVMVDGQLSGIQSVSSGQINLVLPAGLAIDKENQYKLQFKFYDQTNTSRVIFSPSFNITVKPFGFGLFSKKANGKGEAAALNIVYTRAGATVTNSQATPLVRNRTNASQPDVIVLHGTGLGNHRSSSGLLPKVYIDGVTTPLEVKFAGGGGYQGFDQLNVAIPKTLALPAKELNKYQIKVCDSVGANCSNALEVFIK